MNLNTIEVIQNNTNYNLDQLLCDQKRGSWWLEMYKPQIEASVHHAIGVLNLDKPWEEIAQNPVSEALANTIWSTTLSCFGPQLSAATLKELTQARFGIDYVNGSTGHNFTSNHQSIPGIIKPIDSDGQLMKGKTMVHHLPTFATVEGGKPTIGDISPIHLESKAGKFILTLQTPAGHIWQKQFDVLPAAGFFTDTIPAEGETKLVKSIASPCASSFQVTILRDTCQENCMMCTVPKGDGEISEVYKSQVSQTLDLLIDHAAQNHHAFQQSLSAGTISSGDGGFASAHGWALTMIEEKIHLAEQKYEHSIPVLLQLEMVLPADYSSWSGIVQTLKHYSEDIGWKISLAINIEIVQDDWKSLFLLGAIKGKTTLSDHIKFAQMLSNTAGNVQINSLVMFGMKPQALDYNHYLSGDLESLALLVQSGVKPDYQPAKFESGTQMEAYPPPDPMKLFVQDLALKQLIHIAGLQPSIGCVGGCNACDQSHETLALLKTAKKWGIPIPELVAPLVCDIGPEYAQVFNQIFTQGQKGVVYEK